ncbi:MAG: cation:proton antiporter [Steroidobacteraceae bacterium]
MFDAIALVVALTALLAWVNSRFVRLPTTIGVLAIALITSLGLVGLSRLGVSALAVRERELLSSIDFTDVLLQGMLSLLLFAGALHVDLRRLASFRWQIATLAVLGTVASTVLVGFGTWLALEQIDVALPLAFALVFGALISPTDPIAVLGILKTTQVPHSLEITIAGESLFNDGVGIVVFTLLLAMIAQDTTPTFAHGVALFAREALGGAVYGIAIGFVAYRMVKSIDDSHVEILVTLGLVLGGYALAHELHVSGPIAMVAAGLLIGNKGRRTAMSDRTRDALDTFWKVIDETLNAVLFVLIGLEVILIEFPARWLGAALVVIAVTIAARAVTVGLPVAAARSWFALPRGSARVLTWGGVRGGISVALALSLPPGREHELVVMLTYCVVVFSVLGQGLTIAPLVRRVVK